jgi:hypothetical protein
MEFTALDNGHQYQWSDGNAMYALMNAQRPVIRQNASPIGSSRLNVPVRNSSAIPSARSSSAARH